MWIPLTTLMIWPSSSCRVVWFIPLLGSFCASYSMLTGSWITLRTILISSLYLRLKPWRECQAWEEARVCFKLIGLTFGFCVILVSTYIKGWNVTGFSKTMNNGLGNFSIPSRLKNKRSLWGRLGSHMECGWSSMYPFPPHTLKAAKALCVCECLGVVISTHSDATVF